MYIHYKCIDISQLSCKLNPIQCTYKLKTELDYISQAVNTNKNGRKVPAALAHIQTARIYNGRYGASQCVT